jgi:CBS domain-containing protein
VPTVADILRAKASEGRGEVATIGPDATVLDAARIMNQRRIGSLVVTEDGSAHPVPGGNGAVIGMITERDLLTRVVAAELDPSSTPVGRVMTSPVISCTMRTLSDELRAVMRERHIRHVPVVDETGLRGMVSIGDLNNADAGMMEETIRYLETYMYRG